MSKKIRYIFYNDSLVEAQTNIFSGLDRGVMYGDGCFETIRYYKGEFLHFDEHFKRLANGLEYLDIENTLDKNHLKKQIGLLCYKNGMEFKDAAVRIQCTRKGSAGFATHEKGMSYTITMRPIPEKNNNFILKTVSVNSIPTRALNRNFKLSNSINFIKAANEAKQLDGNDALMLTLDGFISETTMANVFWLKDKTIYTPGLDCDILPGITRNMLLEILDGFADYEVATGKFEPDEMKNADCAWACNSIREIIEINGVDEVVFENNHPLLARLMNAFDAYKSNYLKS